MTYVDWIMLFAFCALMPALGLWSFGLIFFLMVCYKLFEKGFK